MKRLAVNCGNGMSVRGLWVLLGVVLAVAPGCNAKVGTERQVAPVKGKLTAKGEAVKSGSISFQPIEDRKSTRLNSSHRT